MALFSLILDEKCAVWRRNYITVEADSLEEAAEKCMKDRTDAATDIEDSFYILESEQLLPPEDGASLEVMDRDYVILKSNETFSR